MRLAAVVCLIAHLVPAQEVEPKPTQKPTAQGSTAEEPAERRETPRDPKLVERDRKLQKVVDELVPLVEKYAELKFPKPPKVRAALHAEWRELLQKELKTDDKRVLVTQSMLLLGIYLPDTAEIVVSPMVSGPLLKELADDAPRHHREAQAHQKATLSHELTHALQDIHFQLPTKMKQLLAAEDDDWRRYKYLLEGHAVFVEERVAEAELGLEDFMVTGPYVGNFDPSYANGWRFCRRTFEKGGMKALKAALAEPPTVAEILAVGSEKAPDESPEGGAQRRGKGPDDGH